MSLPAVRGSQTFWCKFLRSGFLGYVTQLKGWTESAVERKAGCKVKDGNEWKEGPAVMSEPSAGKNSELRLLYLFAHLHLLSSSSFSSLIFFLLLSSSLTLPTSAVHPSILSEVWLLNFLRYFTVTKPKARVFGQLCVLNRDQTRRNRGCKPRRQPHHVWMSVQRLTSNISWGNFYITICRSLQS